jgi:hypothetical protein
MDFADYSTAHTAVRLGAGRGLPRRVLNGARVLADRTAALFLGVGVGAMIGLSFVQHGARAPVSAAAPAAVVAAQPAQAARQAPPPMDAALPFQPHLLNALATGQPVTVGVFGDSFGDGVFTALYRRLPKAGNYKVLKFSEAATGFVHKPDMAATTADRLADQPIDIAVIDFGANDTQGLTQDGKGYALLSPGWRAAYGQRIDTFVAMLRAKGAMVYWLGLPKMRSPEYDQHVAGIEAFYAERMAALGVPYLPVTDLTVDETGQFNAYLADGPDHAQRLMRAGDGIHMSMAGYERISAPLAQRIEAYVGRATLAARLQPQAAQAPAATPQKDLGR